MSAIERVALKAFLDASQQACKVPRPARQVDAIVKRYIWAIREREHTAAREREHDCCGQKIAYFLEREHGVQLSVTKIYQVLNEKYMIRSNMRRRFNRFADRVQTDGGSKFEAEFAHQV